MATVALACAEMNKYVWLVQFFHNGNQNHHLDGRIWLKKTPKHSSNEFECNEMLKKYNTRILKVKIHTYSYIFTLASSPFYLFLITKSTKKRYKLSEPDVGSTATCLKPCQLNRRSAKLPGARKWLV